MMGKMKKKLSPFILILTAFILFLAVDAFLSARKRIVIEGFLVNTQSIVDAKALAKDYGAFLHLGNKDRVYFEDNLSIEPGNKRKNEIASESKIVAHIASGELDFIIIPEGMFSHYEKGVGMKDLLAVTGNPALPYKGGNRKVLDLSSSIYHLSGYVLFSPSKSDRELALSQFISYLYR